MCKMDFLSMDVRNIKPEGEFEEELMDVTEAEVDDCYEEGEINSDDEKDVNVRISFNKPNIFTRTQTTDSVFNKNEVLKKLNRARRFSVADGNTQVNEVCQDRLLSLYRDLGIDKENKRHYRFNSIHMRGTENMNNKDVLQYFEPFTPSYIEWVNNASCNVVWVDDVVTAKVFLNLSKRIKNLDKIHSNADPFEKDFRDDSLSGYSDDDESVDARNIKTAIPPGYWRLGVPCEKGQYVLLRYASRSDKKQRNSEYFKKYGNLNYDNIPGLISNTFRAQLRKQRFRQNDSVRERKQQRIDKKNPWEDLAYEWGKGDKVEDNYDNESSNLVTDFVKSDTPDLRIALSRKKAMAKRLREGSETSPNSSDIESWEKRNKVPRMKMYADNEEKKLEKYVPSSSHCRFQAEPIKDLRNKINLRKKEAKAKFRFKKKQFASVKDLNISENEDDDDGDSVEWALEQYHDLRESLEQNKKSLQQRNKFAKYESESEENLSDSFEERDLKCRSPLQIEIENDECYLNQN